MISEPSVSIITVTYNSGATLKRTIESVLAQTAAPREYIIVDGCSTDDTLSIAESFRETFDEKGISYSVISEPDNGIYDAMNKGIRLAMGDIIGMINSDDWYEPCAVETVLS
ncbi:MAG: glycosyltransferase, partial [Lachnospiraceae bacterium]|nr:glycosyltransferase [Lachnospiraceae bacterium]